jgi:hypothetical protein
VLGGAMVGGALGFVVTGAHRTEMSVTPLALEGGAGILTAIRF